MHLQLYSNARGEGKEKQAGGCAACRELFSVRGAETSTSSVEPSASSSSLVHCQPLPSLPSSLQKLGGGRQGGRRRKQGGPISFFHTGSVSSSWYVWRAFICVVSFVCVWACVRLEQRQMSVQRLLRWHWLDWMLSDLLLCRLFVLGIFCVVVVFAGQPWKFHPGNGSIRCFQLFPLPGLQRRGGFQHGSTQHHQRDGSSPSKHHSVQLAFRISLPPFPFLFLGVIAPG